MIPTDAAWLAGFLDGEGSFMVVVEHPSTRPTFQAIVSATGTDLALIEHCRTIAGGFIVTVHMNRTNAKWKDAYHWRVKGKSVGPVVESVLPYLIGKRRQAELLLELRAMTRLGAEPGTFGRVFNAEDRAKRERIRAEVQALNHRGHVPAAS